ncbi:fasciclin domain-containing protein [Kushneria aurantia]|uniref:Fasciclin domain-containing protein n=1 Tax=Kushneria aurantia TaxID=504092 RepID=A0ABV6FZA0_9GAMM|nr:fasciclin domain-containing protein [Kushneria aurantia]
MIRRVTIALLLAALMATATAASAGASESGQQSRQQQPGERLRGEQRSLLQALEEAGKFNTLLKALRRTGLAEELADGGPWTLFAPTDRAFAQLSDQRRKALLSGNDTAWLRKLLEHHILPGAVPESELGVLSHPQALNGQLRISRTDSGWQVNDVPVAGSEIRSRNAIIYPIDGLLTPFDTTNISPGNH